MTIEHFIKMRPSLYHLTDARNLDLIRKDYTLRSTETLVKRFKIKDQEGFLRTRRVGHRSFERNGEIIYIRDQDPLFKNIVIKNLTDGWEFGDFVQLLNSKVFFWAKETDLQTHYGRYEKKKEYPVVLKIATKPFFELNDNQDPKFCRLNSGGPRCSSYYKEGAPPRGKNTFLPLDQYTTGLSSVREVTFHGECQLPIDDITISKHPNGKFVSILKF